MPHSTREDDVREHIWRSWRGSSWPEAIRGRRRRRREWGEGREGREKRKRRVFYYKLTETLDFKITNKKDHFFQLLALKKEKSLEPEIEGTESQKSRTREDTAEAPGKGQRACRLQNLLKGRVLQFELSYGHKRQSFGITQVKLGMRVLQKVRTCEELHP